MKEKIIGGLNLERFYPELKNHLLLCVTEKRTREEMLSLTAAMAAVEGRGRGND